jgi:hypothetical protein
VQFLADQPLRARRVERAQDPSQKSFEICNPKLAAACCTRVSAIDASGSLPMGLEGSWSAKIRQRHR